MTTSRTVIFWRIAVGVIGISLWQFLSATKMVDPFFFSKPSDIAARVWEWARTGSIWIHLATTLEEALLSFAIGSLLGILFGFALARSPVLSQIFEPYIQVANALPRVVLAPIFLLWFGLGIWSKVALGVTVVYFIVFFNTYQGVRDVDPVILNNARMLGASERQLIRHVFLPSALTWIFSSLHMSIGFAIIAVVVGEYLGAARGIGYVVSQAEGVFDTTGVFAGMAVLSGVVLIIARGVNRLERWLLRWKQEQNDLAVVEVA